MLRPRWRMKEVNSGRRENVSASGFRIEGQPNVNKRLPRSNSDATPSKRGLRRDSKRGISRPQQCVLNKGLFKRRNKTERALNNRRRIAPHARKVGYNRSASGQQPLPHNRQSSANKGQKRRLKNLRAKVKDARNSRATYLNEVGWLRRKRPLSAGGA